jgi:hypothetical protein
MRASVFHIVFLLLSLNSIGQTENFNLTYHVVGLGSNMGKSFYPLVKINGSTLTYTIEQNTSVNKIEKWRKTIDTIWNTKTVDFSINLSKETIHTIFNLVKDIKDTLIFKSNHCIMSGGVDIISISDGSFKVAFHLMNTFDSTALAICNILNYYLPEKNKIWIEPDFMKKRKDCDAYFDRRIEEDKKQKLKATKSNK